MDLVANFEANQITGMISDGSTTADFVVDRAIYSATNPQTNYAGKYTFILPHDSDANTSPGGYGFGLISVSTNGAISTAGSFLGDNTMLTQAGVSVSKDGRWPLYSALYTSKYVTNKFLTPFTTVTNIGFRGAIMGWLQFTNNAAIGGDVKWFKTPVAGHLPVGYIPPFSTNYPAGFTNEIEVTGLRYVSVLATQPILSLTYPAPTVKLFTNSILTLQDGNLTASLTNKLFIHANNIVTLPSTNSGWTGISGALFSPVYAVANGGLSGTFYHPYIKKLIPFKGAVLQGQKRAYGYFQGYRTNGVGANQTGSVMILSVP